MSPFPNLVTGLKASAQQLTRTLGLEVRRLPKPWSIDPTEAAELDALLEEFARLHPDDYRPWSEPKRAKEYLTPKRIASYHDLLATCARNGIEWDDRAVAEVGSGTGYLLRTIARAAPSARLFGFDTYSEILELSRHLCPSAQYVERNLFDIEDRAAFDVVVCMEVLEHLIDPEEALARLLGMVAGGGWLVLTVPDGRWDTLEAYTLYRNGRGYWGHINFWSPESWHHWMAKNVGTRLHCCGNLVTGENYALVQQK